MALSIELSLISASIAVGEPADCDVVFNLERCRGLPDISQAHPWAGKTISPLRDRTMVEWLFTRPSATSQLGAMTSSIDATLRKRIEETKKTKEKKRDKGEEEEVVAPKRVRVGVTCSHGTQLSPCFVEKLLQHYESSTCWKNLVVRRFHWDAHKGAWGRNKDFVWQQKNVPARMRDNHSDVAFDEMWTAFPSSVSAAIETAFSQDPLCSKFQYEGYSFNFETGVVYNSIRRNSYQFRCNMSLSNSKINCWFVGDSGYTSCSHGYRAAGILPYSVFPGSGEAIFLLGRITYECGDWCDFGGLKSYRERPRFTAARECYEETLGILGSTRHLSVSLRDFATNNAFKVVNMDTRYVSHFLRVPYQDYPQIFQSRRKEEEDKGERMEVSQIRWFPLSSIREAVKGCLLGQQWIAAEPLKQPQAGPVRRRQGRSPHLLRREFVYTLCIADKLGILESIEHIARERHRSGGAGREGRRKAGLPPNPDPQHSSDVKCSSHSDNLKPPVPSSNHCTSDSHDLEPHTPGSDCLKNHDPNSHDSSSDSDNLEPNSSSNPVLSLDHTHTIESDRTFEDNSATCDCGDSVAMAMSSDRKTRTEIELEEEISKLKMASSTLDPSVGDSHRVKVETQSGSRDDSVPQRAKVSRRKRAGEKGKGVVVRDSRDHGTESGPRVMYYGMGAGKVLRIPITS